MEGASVPLTQATLQILRDAWNPRDARLQKAAARAIGDFCACASAGKKHLPSGWPSRRAARLAVAADALDRDDVHWDSLTHPGSVIWPVIVDLGGELGVDGETALMAGTFGYEVTGQEDSGRAGAAAHPKPGERLYVSLPPLGGLLRQPGRIFLTI